MLKTLVSTGLFAGTVVGTSKTAAAEKQGEKRAASKKHKEKVRSEVMGSITRHIQARIPEEGA